MKFHHIGLFVADLDAGRRHRLYSAVLVTVRLCSHRSGPRRLLW